MKLKIISKEEQPLLDRNYYDIELEFEKVTSTREEIINEFTKIEKTEKEKIIVDKINTFFGKKMASARIYVYNTKEALNKLTPNFLIKRHQKNKKEEAESEKEKQKQEKSE